MRIIKTRNHCELFYDLAWSAVHATSAPSLPRDPTPTGMKNLDHEPAYMNNNQIDQHAPSIATAPEDSLDPIERRHRFHEPCHQFHKVEKASWHFIGAAIDIFRAVRLGQIFRLIFAQEFMANLSATMDDQNNPLDESFYVEFLQKMRSSQTPEVCTL